ncbi:MAG: hypothetical protein A2751_05270 [Candidatus Doudnabacteria bacterium RIFCSPHIGHO2_01_FULL_46_14]|uniref:Baseplate protein J-like domain-containing protein n=1 Tax=Candidatus Doudnabacteria bacterium RIFCSPHIGHO2_01_FULL_46_14 TaxID=1817824 RepID=A0A1F5NNZ7_9BACT|nr:MAG: hypothetical protein A2751_05270 [Candidatus Doudnabacteria bacterium RIFCSPHIGHO2_01_FULL_46_14]
MKNLDIVRKDSLGPVKTAPKIFTPSPEVPARQVLRPRYKLRALVAAVFLIALVVGGLYIFLPQATITVKARTEPVARDFEIRVDQNTITASSADMTVPGKIIEREVSGQKQYASTGTRNIGKTASGFVSIYNFSKSTLILKAQTTVLTANGRKYFFTQDATGIRPTARIGLEDEEIDETSLAAPVPLVAAAAGEEYNLPAGTRLEIQNEAFGAQPQKLYAVAGEGISGGTTRIAKLVTQNDLDTAYQALASELLDQTRAELTKDDPGARVLDNAFTSQILEQQSQTAVGTETASFEVSGRVKIRALAYDEKDVRKIIFEMIKRLLPEQKILLENSATVDASFLSLSLDQAAGTLSAHFQGTIVYRLDREELREKVRGKTTEEIREIMLSKPEIDSLEVQFSPFWVKSAPKLRPKIKIVTAD